MIAFISLCYASLYILIFNKLKLLPKTTPNVSAFVGVGVIMIAAIVFAWYTFAPMSSDTRVVRYVIPIVPNVSGQLVEVSVTTMQRVKKGDPLYRIDPTPYQHQVDELAAGGGRVGRAQHPFDLRSRQRLHVGDPVMGERGMVHTACWHVAAKDFCPI